MAGMSSSAGWSAGWSRWCALAVALAGASPAQAQVTQTDAVKTPLPQPVPAAEASLVNQSWAWNSETLVNRDPMGLPLNPAVKYGTFYSPPTYPQFVTGDAINLSGLFKWRHEMIDPIKDAKTGPGYFSAKCGFSGQVLLMGGNCQVKFGWYNVLDPKSKTPPVYYPPAANGTPDPRNEVFPFIENIRDSLMCVEQDGTPKMDGFCPLAWDNRHPYDLSIKRWVPRSFDSGDISKNKNYKGGYVAFAVIGDPAKCPQNKFSMLEHNQRNENGEPWVTTLVYQSTVDPGGFYMAFEDQPMPATDWKMKGCDGDFNDLVFYVSGLTCEGGNKPCDTKLLGACSVGRTDCAANGEASICRPVIKPGAETCDNVDNDCDGVVDNGNGLCTDPEKPICFQGNCVGTCANGEFPCPVGLTCDETGHCADPVCAAVTCKAGTACRNGSCVDPCDGVVCPYLKQCQLGQCVDPCGGVTCPGDRVCEKGLCVSNCSCRGCDTGLSCATDGRCVDTACATKSCADGLLCKLGECIDACAGVICPGNGTCSKGVCSAPMPGTGATGSGANGSVDFGGGTGLAFGGSGNTAGGSTLPGGTAKGATSTSACSCRVTGGPNSGSLKFAWLGAGLAVGLWLRKRRGERAA